MSPCSVQTALMETWMSLCGHCRYWLNKAFNRLLAVATWSSDHISCFSAEWHPALLWLPGSGPPDFLGSVLCFIWGARRHAGGLARTSTRPAGRGTTLLHSYGLLWWGEGFPAEAWGLWETCHQGVWTDSGDPPRQATASQQPDESWSLKPVGASWVSGLSLIVCSIKAD